MAVAASPRTAPVDVDRLLRLDVSALDADDCEARLRDIQLVRGRLAGLETRISARIEALHDNGEASPAADTHARSQRVSAAEARRRERRARAVRDVPRLGEGLDDGSVTPEHVDAYASATAKASDEARATLAHKQRQIRDQAEKLTPEKFRTWCDRQVQNAEADNGLDRDDQQRKATKARSWINAQTGMRHIAAELHPELGSRIWNAVQADIAAQIMRDDHERLVDRDRLAAEALGRLVSGGHAAARPNRADILALIDLDSLLHGLHDGGVCELSDLSILPVETLRRLACDGNIIPAVLGGNGEVLDLGRSRRLASPAQRKALRAMHDTCAFPGCDVEFDRCEIHHLLDWDQMFGPTDLANLVPGCSRHHHLVHEGGWSLRLNPDRTLSVWGPGQKAPPDAVPQAKAGPHHRRPEPPGAAAARNPNPAPTALDGHDPSRPHDDDTDPPPERLFDLAH